MFNIAFRQLGTLRKPSTFSSPSVSSGSAEDSRLQNTVLPASLDYSNYNGRDCINGIKNQKNCGSCWAFAATAYYESQLCINNFNYTLSEEASLECTTLEAPNGRSNSCNGGYISDSLDYYAKVGGVI